LARATTIHSGEKKSSGSKPITGAKSAAAALATEERWVILRASGGNQLKDQGRLLPAT